jgi:hypothetical protein
MKIKYGLFLRKTNLSSNGFPPALGILKSCTRRLFSTTQLLCAIGALVRRFFGASAFG